MNSLYDISNEIREIYYKLENGEGFDPETGEINEDIQNALILSQQNLQAKGIDIGYVIKSFDDQIDLYDREIKRLTEIKDQMKKRREWLKDNLTNAMLEFNIKEIQGKTLKINFRKSESVEIDNIFMLDDRFKITKTEIKPDKTAIKQAIKLGEYVEGARLVENQNLQIR